jgi:hypothetical protein
MHLKTKYIRQKLIELEGEIGKSTITVEDFNITLSVTDTPAGRESVRICVT